MSAEVKAPGTYHFGVSSASSNSVIYSSREGSHPPELVVFTAPAVPALGVVARALLVATLVATPSALGKRHGRLARGLSGRARARAGGG